MLLATSPRISPLVGQELSAFDPLPRTHLIQGHVFEVCQQVLELPVAGQHAEVQHVGVGDEQPAPGGGHQVRGKHGRVRQGGVVRQEGQKQLAPASDLLAVGLSGVAIVGLSTGRVFKGRMLRQVRRDCPVATSEYQGGVKI